MIQELVSLSKKLREEKLVSYIDDALDNVSVSITCEIDRKGNFKQFIVSGDKKNTLAEALTSKKGKARLLIDKAEETLAYVGVKRERNDIAKVKSKHKLYLDKLAEYSNLPSLHPVVSFYSKNRIEGVQKARELFSKQIDEKFRVENIAFKLTDEKKWLHDSKEVRNAIVNKYREDLKGLKTERFLKCSICGCSDYPITDEFPHGMIKRVPAGQTSGCALVSYNEKVFESYGLEGNENASICTHCAKAYVETLNWLLTAGSIRTNENGEEYFDYRHRHRISEDTAVVFWLRDAIKSEEISWLDKPPDESRIREMIRAIETGKERRVRKTQIDKFYAITLSGSAARIAVRDWIETSLPNLRDNLAKWFADISVGEYDKDKKAINVRYPSFYSLVSTVKSKGGKDTLHGRIGAALWRSAILGIVPPLWVLRSVLSRIRAEQGKTTCERISLLKFTMNRNTNQQGGIPFMETLDESNQNNAYLCGRTFAVLESIQYHAHGENINATIRDRFFSFASAMPAAAFGRLLKLSQHHLSKIRGEKPGLAINLDKKLGELVSSLKVFPSILSLEDQASFAIGYYHQRQKDFTTKTDKKEK